MKRLTGFFLLLIAAAVGILNTKVSVHKMTTNDTLTVAGEGKPCPDKEKANTQKA